VMVDEVLVCHGTPRVVMERRKHDFPALFHVLDPVVRRLGDTRAIARCALREDEEYDKERWLAAVAECPKSDERCCVVV
jgi:hypothetical protein